MIDTLMNPKWQEIIEKIQQMTLMDDIFFNSFMENNKASMEYILNIIMNRYDLKVLILSILVDTLNSYKEDSYAAIGRAA